MRFFGGKANDLEQRLAEAERQLEQKHSQLLKTRAQLKRYARDSMLLRLGAAIPDSVGAEIGVDEGEFSQQILAVARPRKLHLIDPWEHHENAAYKDSCYGGLERGQREMDEKYDEVWRKLSGEIGTVQVAVHRSYSGRVADEFEDSYLDWVYIDANHQYEFVKADLETYRPKVGSSGFILGDDYGIKGWFDNGVTKAVDEFVKKNGFDLRVDFTQYMIRL